MNLLRSVCEFVKSNWALIVGVGAAVVIAWRAIRGRKIAQRLRSITFDPHGLREPVDNIARGGGSNADCARINLFLGETGYITTYISDFYRHQEGLRRQLGDTDAGILQEQVQFAKKHIREDLKQLCQLDPGSPEAVELAGKIAAAMIRFNKDVRKILDRHYRGFFRAIGNRFGKIGEG